MHKYAKIIKEDEEELKGLAKQHRHSVVGKRILMLLKLKTKEARSLAAVAKQLNYSLRQCQRWFKSYQNAGIVALLETSEQGKKSAERMTQRAWQVLNEALIKGEIASYPQVRKLLKDQGVIYKDDSSILKLFKRHQIKGKTGRPLHEKTDLEAQEAFKKTLLSS